ncbi:MAG: T9SS type A sorting domain-containing protein [Bacteroidetes bacterium]|nr:MAG: T9SS type A sorting domain-containing protein [Bacteroidota bacterium]
MYNNWKISVQINGTPFEPESEFVSEAILYPNPFSDMLNIRVENKDLAFETFKIEIFDLLGNSVKQLVMNSYNSKIQFTVSDLSRGIYMIHLFPKNKTEVKSYCIKAVKL